MFTGTIGVPDTVIIVPEVVGMKEPPPIPRLHSPIPDVCLSRFSMARPAYQVEQERALEWITALHTAAETAARRLDGPQRLQFATRLRKLVDRCACKPDQIGSRGCSLDDIGRADFGELSIYDVLHHAHGKGARARSRRFAELVSNYFDAEYANEQDAPSDLIHVTCTGYVAPSGAQAVVAKKGWGARTRVTHAYHMGCYAALPALRVAAGCVLSSRALNRGEAPPARVDIAHTELCSLHLDPGDHSMEQLVVQSLFADGFIRYSMQEGGEGPRLALLCEHEVVLPDTAECMTWVTSDAGMRMTLARDVPGRIAGGLRQFVQELYARSGSPPREPAQPVFAVHPGGPRILDLVGEVLELDSAQLQTSREVLFEYGNMSSATLPHVWMRILNDARVAPGTPVVSLAFGPGLTVCGALFVKH